MSHIIFPVQACTWRRGIPLVFETCWLCRGENTIPAEDNPILDAYLGDFIGMDYP